MLPAGECQRQGAAVRGNGKAQTETPRHGASRGDAGLGGADSLEQGERTTRDGRIMAGSVLKCEVVHQGPQ